MANLPNTGPEWESQKLEGKKSSFGELVQLINALQGVGEKDREKKATLDNAKVLSYASNIFNSFDDESFTSNLGNLNNWYE